MDKICRECNHKNKPRARKCSSCGASLVNKKQTQTSDSSSISSMATVIDKKAGKERGEETSEQKNANLHKGDIIAKRYELLGKIGEGGIGQVWKVNDRKLDRQVALKKLHFKFSSSVDAYNRFIREAKVLSKLNDPNICNIYDLVEDKGASYISMEYHPGKSLAEALRGKTLTREEKIETALGISRGLMSAHSKGIVHRDMKPSNIMIDPVKILDFGLAKQREDESPGEDASKEHNKVTDIRNEETILYSFAKKDRGKTTKPSGKMQKTTSPSASEDITSAGALVGTIKYMSPEQAGGEQLDNRSDIFSLGIILYEMFSGQAPFEGKSSEILVKIRESDYTALTSRKIRGCPRSLRRMIDRALLKSRSKRPNASEFADLFSRLRRKLLQKTLPWVALIAIAAVALTFSLTRYVFTPAVSKSLQLAVLDTVMTSDDPQTEWLRTAIPDTLRTILHNSPGISPVGGKRIASVTKQLKLVDGKTLIGEKLRNISNFLSESNIAVLSLGKNNDNEIVLKISVYDAKGELLGEEESVQSSLDLFTLAEESARGIFSILNIGEDSINIRSAYSENTEVNQAFFRGKSLFEADKPHAAKTDLLAAVAGEKEFALAHLLLAEVWETIGYNNRSFESLARALVNQERLPLNEKLNAQADLAILSGFPEKSLAIFETILKNRPGDRVTRHKLGYVLISLSKYDEAKKLFNTLYKEKPEDYAALEALALIDSDEGKLKDAEKKMEELHRILRGIGNREMAAKTAIDLAWTKKLLGKLDESEKLLRDSIDDAKKLKMTKEEAKGFSRLAYLLEAKGDIIGAEEATQKAYDLFRLIGNKNGEGDTLTDLAWYRLTDGKPHEAENLYKKALDIWNGTGNKIGQGSALYYMAWVAYNRGDYIRASDLFPEAIEIAYELGNRQYLSGMHGGLAATYLILGKLDEAEKAYKIELKYAKLTTEPQGLSITYDNFAMFEMAKGNYNLAREYSRKALALGNKTSDEYMLGTSLTVAGWIEYLDGSDYNKAIKHFRASIPKLRNTNKNSWLSLALALKAATEGRIDKSAQEKSIKELEKALSLCRRKGRKNHLVEIYLIKGDFARYAIDESTAVETYKEGLSVAQKYSMAYYKGILNSRLK